MTGGKGGAWRSALLLAYLAIPSVVWTFVYRDIKIVADVVLLLAVESLVPRIVARLVRLAWCLLCVTMLLLEWNIFPESYGFYFGLMVRAASFPQGRAVLAGFMLLLFFLALPPPRVGYHARASLIALYLLVTVLKLVPITKPHAVWLRQPVLRAAQVAWSDWSRLRSASVEPGRYDALTPGYQHLRSWIDADRDAPVKIFVLLLESWGQSPGDFRRTMADVSRRASGASVQGGFVPFSGPTLSGEVRELCGRALSFRSIDASLSDCLPRAARGRGYETTAFHGYEAYFYNRQIIYPQFGFSRAYFSTDMIGRERCGGAFDGVCDDAVLTEALRRLRRPGRQFVYMMSLSAHEPVDPAMAAKAYIRAVPGQLNGARVNAALLRLAVDRSAQLAQREDVALYIAGDHNPPGGEQSMGLPRGRVPYLLMRWRH